MNILFIFSIKTNKFIYRSFSDKFIEDDGNILFASPSSKNSLVFEELNKSSYDEKRKYGNFISNNPLLKNIISEKVNKSTWKLIDSLNGNVCLTFNNKKNLFERNECNNSALQLFKEIPFNELKPEDLKSNPTNYPYIPNNMKYSPDNILANNKMNDIGIGMGIFRDLDDHHVNDTASDQFNDLKILKGALNFK